MTNTTVRCDRSGATRDVRFARCLARACPTCCGSTMRPASYRCVIEQEVGAALEGQGLPRVVRRFRAGGR